MTNTNTTPARIKLKYENSWYGYQGRDGYALYINGEKMHIGLFNTISDIRDYWRKYMPLLIAGIIPGEYKF
jgi:hypothetical protein